MAKVHVTTSINGEPMEFLCEPSDTMLDALRGPLALRGTSRAVSAEDYEQLAAEAAPEVAEGSGLAAVDGKRVSESSRNGLKTLFHSPPRGPIVTVSAVACFALGYVLGGMGTIASTLALTNDVGSIDEQGGARFDERITPDRPCRPVDARCDGDGEELDVAAAGFRRFPTPRTGLTGFPPGS